MATKIIPRSEYPRPEAQRKEWLCLNGQWDFEFDPDHMGMKDHWFLKPNFSKKITVPYVFQSKLSGINSQEFIDTVWYARSFTIPETFRNKTILLHFGAVDYQCDIFLNGALVGSHFGGLTPFFFDLSDFLTDDRAASQLLVVKVFDPPFDKEIPRGKQSTEARFSGCDYEKSTGIWQTVWLEFVGNVYLDRSDYYIRPNLATGEIETLIALAGKHAPQYVIEAQVFDGDSPISETNFALYGSAINQKAITTGRIPLQVDLSKIIKWTPSNRKMYTVHFRVIDGDADEEGIVDELICSFGFRTIETRGTKILLNGEPIYLKMALYQGYWVESLWTPPTDADIKQDMELTLEMGFNSLRLHQKVEDPRLIYWADQLGVLLWGEIANCGDSGRAKQRLAQEWSEAVRRDRNHPSIIAWTPLNESWGTGDLAKNDNQEWVKSIYYLTKGLDPTRPISENDGWEHVVTDICSIHDYSQPEVFATHYPEKEPADLKSFLTKLQLHRKTYAPGCEYITGPIMITEWGGWGHYMQDPTVKPDHYKYWGYQGILYKTFDEVLDLYEATIKELVKRKDWISGHCYTEFNDQYQEVNGMLTYDRKPKGDLKRLKAINDLLN
jgi:beta-galactosidase/beta-glucuronidase